MSIQFILICWSLLGTYSYNQLCPDCSVLGQFVPLQLDAEQTGASAEGIGVLAVSRGLERRFTSSRRNGVRRKLTKYHRGCQSSHGLSVPTNSLKFGRLPSVLGSAMPLLKLQRAEQGTC